MHHPDKNQSADEERFKAISAAYEDICKHIKGQEEVDYEDPDFQLIYELLHLFNMLEADNTDASSPVEGYASGGSSCEADSDDGDEASEATDSDAA